MTRQRDQVSIPASFEPDGLSLNRLRLPEKAIDSSRVYQTALSFTHRLVSDKTTILLVKSIDGSWSKTAQEPELRIEEVLGASEHSHLGEHPFSIPSHLPYQHTQGRWTNALSGIHGQPITY